ncbi:acyl-CoA dehydratase activase-related protein [Acetivibrio cellulolyticus]|uniref:acyl-CoA dehydratase activase-related protein n=1 Tax=Acetivibrio cellulolyticus TaxID=35830 RepID=UPI0001E2E381|nr:acyl-CoA dehydratase activase-related protein [Acetivibrio cellulolyticus]
MSKKVGIPRALFYYQYFPLWKTFFEELGAEVVVSGNTSKTIINNGSKTCVDEACLPIKIFYGHIIDIKDKVDFLFIPRFTSVSKGEYICPKFGGLPDMVRNTFSSLPEVIDADVDLWKKGSNPFIPAFEVGSYFSADRRQIRIAYQKAIKEFKEYRLKVKEGILPDDILFKKLSLIKKNDEPRLNIAVIGHSYNIYDDYVNMNMAKKLKNSGVNIITIDMVDSSIINEKLKTLSKKMFWNYGTRAMGSALHFLDRKDIDGIIYLMSFGCGIDSFVGDLIERNVRRKKDLPFIVLTIDEHSGEAGIDTRIEAFIDMIRWRNKSESNVSAHG